MSGKTEKPTAKRLREARVQGNFARSRLLGAALVFGGAGAGVAAAGPLAWRRLQEWTTGLLSGAASPGAHAVLHQGLEATAWLVLPPMLGGLVGGLTVSVLQAGLHFHPGQLRPDLSRVDPFGGFQRLLSKERFAEVSRSLLFATLLLTALGGFVWSDAAAVLRSGRGGGEGALTWGLLRLGSWGQALLGLVLLCGVGDYLWARHRHLRSLAMSRDELRQEHRASEGDPHHRAHRKSAHRQLALQGPARGVQKASVIVVNPTHIAVALRYAEDECEAPYLVAKGREEDALRLRREAARLGIPVVRDIPLARSLVHYDVGAQIPPELYGAAAAVLRAALDVRNPDRPSRSQTP